MHEVYCSTINNSLVRYNKQQFTAVQQTTAYCSAKNNSLLQCKKTTVYCSATNNILLQCNKQQFTAVQQTTVYCSTTSNRFHRGVFSILITLADSSVVEKHFASSFKIEDYRVEGSSIFLPKH
jgi:hypothetical protein